MQSYQDFFNQADIRDIHKERRSIRHLRLTSSRHQHDFTDSLKMKLI